MSADLYTPNGFQCPAEMPDDLRQWCVEFSNSSGWVFEHPLLRLDFPLWYREELRNELEKKEAEFQQFVDDKNFERALQLVETDTSHT